MKRIKNINLFADNLVEKTKRLNSQADVHTENGWGTSVSFENDKLKSISSAQQSSISFRLIKNGKVGISGSTRVDKKETEAIFDDAIGLSEFGKKVQFKLPKRKTTPKKPKMFDSSVSEIKPKEFIIYGKKIIKLVKQKEKDMRVTSLSFSNKQVQSYFANTAGVTDREKGTLVTFSIELSRIKHGDFFQLYDGQTSVKNDIDYIGLTEKLLKQVKWGRNISKISQGKYPVVFTPEAVSNLTGFLLTSLNGKSVNERTSKFESLKGKKLFDNRLTIIDDPTPDYYPNSYALDDEGVTGRKNILIDSGVIKKFYYDLEQAKKANAESTGNGGRSGIYSHSFPTTSNIFVKKGKKDYKELISGIKEGVLAYEFLGAGQNNPFNGDFQLGLYMGYKIENGEIVGRLKNTSISGNAFELLKENLLWLSRDTERHGGFESPYLCLDGVMVLSK